MANAKSIARNTGCLLFAYAIIVAFGFLALEILFGKVSFGETPLPIAIVAGLLNVFGAVVAGFVIRLLGASFVLCIILLCWLSFESTVIHFSGSVNPFWLDVGSGVAQGLGVFLGFYAFRRRVHADA